MAFSKNLNRTFCRYDCSCKNMLFRDKLDHIVFAYDRISCFRPLTFRDNGIIFKFPCTVKQNTDSDTPERLEEMAFKVTACLVENLVRHLFCLDPHDTKTIDYHFDELVWTKNYLITHYYYPETWADALLPPLSPSSPHRVPRLLSLCITSEIYWRGPKNVNYPPLEVDVQRGK